MAVASSSLVSHFRRADFLMLPLLWGLFVLALFLAPWWNTWGLALTLGLAFAAVPTVVIFLKPGTRLARLSVGVAFMLFSALHIHQSMGQTELHFGIFVLLAMLLCYRDWLVIVTAAGVAAVHHIVFNYLQGLGWGAMCFAQPGWGRVLAHAAYVVVETAVLSYIAIWLQRDAIQNGELRELVNRLSVQQDGTIDLSVCGAYFESEGAQELAESLQEVRSAIDRVRAAAFLNLELLANISRHGCAVMEHASQGLVETVQSFRLENERPHQQGRGLTAVAAVALPSSALGAA